MKDGLLLLLSGIVCAALAWLFFNQLQNHAFTALLIILAMVLAAKPLGKIFRSKAK